MTIQKSMPLKKPSTLLILFIFLFAIASGQNTANWQALGPIQFPFNNSGQINGIGRVCQMKFHPTDSQKVYAVSASGGLWISSNATGSWQKTGSDKIALSACSSVCIDFTNDSILYLSTGDPNYYSTGSGIYRSNDAGNNWFPANNNIGNRMAVELVMDPLNHEIIVAATNDGIWKTVDGGLSWNVRKSGGQFTEMAAKPAPGSRTLYAVTYSEFYKSEDFGDTWSLISNGIAVPGGGSGQGMRLAVSAADSTVVYAGMIKDEGTIFRSNDGGNTFTTVYHNPAQSLVGYDANGNGQGNYNFSMCAAPNNPNVVFVGAHVVWRSTDGGVTWTQLTQWWQILHTDMHQMLYNPYATQELYNINDGGIWRSLNAGVNWGVRCNGLEATEIYKAASNPVRKDNLSIGTQDNGELFSANGQWRTNRGGDWSSRMTFDYQNYNLVYYHENGKRRNVISGPEVSFGLPFTSSNNLRLAFTPLNSEMGLAGIGDLYLSSDLSSPVPFWTPISSFAAGIKSIEFASHTTDMAYVLTIPNQFRKFSGLNTGTIASVSSNLPSTLTNGGSVTGLVNDSNVIYVTAGSKVYRSADQGISWSNVTFNLPNINIIKIIHDPYSTDESVYISNTAGIWYKNQTMSSWFNYSQGLPAIASITDFMYVNDGPANSVIRVSTYGRGVWESTLQGTISSTPESSLPDKWLVAPNPARNVITVSSTTLKEKNIVKIQFYSINGSLISEYKINPPFTSGDFSIAHFPPGSYQLLLITDKGQTEGVGKFVKE
ncbi:MAG: hypothetical protein IPM91_18075 [Bacteroidetes bacterium]|nr:hypothetical protein [Bacteroidota bacterium]